MEHRRSLISTAEALHRIFSTGTAPRLLFQTRLPPPTQRQQKRPVTFVSKRFAAAQGQLPSQFGSSNGPLRDENISGHEVHIVVDGKLQPAQPLSTVLYSFDRQTHFLVQVSPPDADQTPVCKIIDKQTVRAAERAKAKPVKNAQTATKQLELNWAIGGNDLGHRLNKMEEFLREGRRVEIVLAMKLKGRVASKEEAEAVVSKIRAKIKEVEGAKEWRAADGAVGRQLTLYFEGKAKK